MTTHICGVCDAPRGESRYRVREMMFGTRVEFEYFACPDCHCLQIASIPSDLGVFYSGDYYSLNDETAESGFLQRLLKRHRGRYGLGKKNLLGLLVAKKYGLPDVYKWAAKAQFSFDSQILDVGCGKGFLLRKLQEEGFTNLVGIDPYAPEETAHGGSLRIYRRELADISGEFDFVMLNHSLEHMAEPRAVLKEVYRVLKHDRYAMIRIPVVPSYAWRTYGVHWVQWDAPRHLFLHSVQSMSLLASQAGFQVSGIDYDSEALQFWGSELYARDIALNEYQKAAETQPDALLFRPADIERFKLMAKELNERRDGDQACFYLFKP